ncbi:sodium ion-translocating decarboxylase subunit beta [Clostridium lundense]|uniref:sodium ion-translocating decarboxylase subunit beta n=1 Tax=Clostridium lundense TaxID=319475 RepID=UPI0004880821|nr:sodium ion-translocating decarboxylase subunit beta [Clostridium lundense]
MDLAKSLENLWLSSGFMAITGKQVIMILISCFLIYLAIKKEFEPLLLLTIAFGMLVANLPLGGLEKPPIYEFKNGQLITKEIGGLFYYLYKGVELDIYPPLIFLGVGAMTDFAPLIANPSSILMGAGAQFGVFFTFICALLLGFDSRQAASISIIGGADGPTAIYLTSQLAKELLGPVAVAAYSYMALVPLIQPPIMKALTTKEERTVRMGQLRQVKKVEKIIFPIVVTILVTLFLPSIASLISMLMLGNLFRESLVVDRLSDTAQNALINIITIFLGLTVGGTARAEIFLRADTIKIIALGVVAFSISTVGGVVIGKIMYKLSGGKVNPLIGSAGVSAVPMAARVSQVVGQEEDPGNFLLMHAMGPNVAGVIGTAVAAGVLLTLFK